MYTGESGIKEYLKAFFKEFGFEEDKIEEKVKEAYEYIITHPNEENIFGIKVHKRQNTSSETT